jgi:antitoxin ParD1/3/4
MKPLSIFDIGRKKRYQSIMTLTISLTPHLESFIHQTVSSGRYKSASELVRTALLLLEERDRQQNATLEWLARETQKGLDSGPSEPVTPAFWNNLRARLRHSSSPADHAETD